LAGAEGLPGIFALLVALRADRHIYKTKHYIGNSIK